MGCPLNEHYVQVRKKVTLFCISKLLTQSYSHVYRYTNVQTHTITSSVSPLFPGFLAYGGKYRCKLKCEMKNRCIHTLLLG